MICPACESKPVQVMSTGTKGCEACGEPQYAWYAIVGVPMEVKILHRDWLRPMPRPSEGQE